MARFLQQNDSPVEGLPDGSADAGATRDSEAERLQQGFVCVHRIARPDVPARLLRVQRGGRVVGMVRVRSAQVQDAAGFERVPETAADFRVAPDVFDDFRADDFVEGAVERADFVQIQNAERQPVLRNAQESVEQLAAALDLLLLDADADHAVALEVALIREHAVAAAGVQHPAFLARAAFSKEARQCLHSKPGVKVQSGEEPPLDSLAPCGHAFSFRRIQKDMRPWPASR